ncbi:MAG: hypothetical protein ACYTGG_00580 [Planctomycetota bacterium]|jgi:hypothetical protein
MTRSSDRKKRRSSGSAQPSTRRARDRTIYLGILVIGAFGLMLWALVSPETWRPAIVGFLIAVAVFVNHSVYLAYRGRDMPRWRQALARLPLRFVGYGRRGGKPLEAAHDHAETKLVLLVSIAVWVVIIVVATFLLIPEVRS